MASPQRESSDVAIVGGGVIGLSVAWHAARRGLRACVLERGTLAAEASHVAAGMLAPVTEAEFGEDDLLRLSLAAAERWPAWAAELERASGRDPELRRCGTLMVARDADEAEALERLLDFRRALGLDVERLRPSAARRLEPALAPTVRLAAHVQSDHAVDPRAVLRGPGGGRPAGGARASGPARRSSGCSATASSWRAASGWRPPRW